MSKKGFFKPTPPQSRPDQVALQAQRNEGLARLFENVK